VAVGRQSAALVSLHDLTATFLAFAQTPALPEMEARSLLALLAGETDLHRNILVSALGEWCMVYDGRYKLVAGDGPKPRLFDLLEDPHECIDIAGERPEVAATLMEGWQTA
jgi:arylsulfatase A-like enzyme